jgi:hypothetical protein
MTVTLTSGVWAVTSDLIDWGTMDSAKLYIDTTDYDLEDPDTEFEIDSDPDDGVYQFILEVTRGSTVVREKSCYFVDETFNCEVVTAVYNTGNDKAALYYYLLKNASACTDCEKLKELFIIANNLVDDDCGCR